MSYHSLWKHNIDDDEYDCHDRDNDCDDDDSNDVHEYNWHDHGNNDDDDDGHGNDDDNDDNDVALPFNTSGPDGHSNNEQSGPRRPKIIYTYTFNMRRMLS